MCIALTPLPAPCAQTGRIVAIKKIRTVNMRDGVDIPALREIKLLRELRHPHLVELVDVFARKQNISLVLEYCDSDLEKVIRDRAVVLTHADIKAYMQARGGGGGRGGTTPPGSRNGEGCGIRRHAPSMLAPLIGGSLFQAHGWVAPRFSPPACRPLPPPQGLLKALTECHAAWVLHRDIKVGFNDACWGE